MELQPLQVFTFGELRVTLGGNPLAAFESRKAAALLVYLACERRAHQREVLADLLWDERSQQQAFTNLRVVLAKLRKPLGPYLHITRELIAINPEAPVWCDCVELEARLEAAQAAFARDPEAGANAIEHALELYQGEFLQGFYLRGSQGFEHWIVQERERLHLVVTRKLHDLVNYELKAAKFEAGIGHARRLLALDPFSELAHQQAIRMLACGGWRSEALAQYETCKQMLRLEYGVEPAAETHALAQKIRSGELTAPVESRSPSETGMHVSNPYRGLSAFQEADSGVFFGREALTSRLISRLAEPGIHGRFLAVVGPSGGGKSSLLNAGLVPALRAGAVPGSESWHLVQMAPGAHPFEALEAALVQTVSQPSAGLAEVLRRDHQGLQSATRLLLQPEETDLLLVIDQFEELFTLVENKEEIWRFLQSLFAAVTGPENPVRVVLALRADFFDRPLLHPDFSTLIQERTEVVTPLSVEELEHAIRLPALQVGVIPEPELVTAIVADMVEQPGALPLLQYALTELFERRTGNRLTVEAYHNIGGVRGVLEGQAERIFTSLSEAGKHAARQIFLRLVTLGEGTVKQPVSLVATRRRVLRSELEAITLPRVEISQLAVGETLEAFGRVRLLTFDWDPSARSATIEIAHEALLDEWKRLRHWLDENRADMRMQRLLGNAAAEWARAGRDASFLLHGERLALFENWSKGSALALTAEEHAFLQASLAQREALRNVEAARIQREASLERRSRNFLRLLVVVLLIASAGALSLAGLAIRQSRLATSRELALVAINNLQSDPERSIILALLALRTSYTREAEEALHQALQSSRVRMALPGHAGGANMVEYSPDGQTLLTGSSAGEITLWESESGKQRFQLAGTAARFSPQGSRLAIGNQDGIVRILDSASQTEVRLFQGHHGWINDIHFSPDGRFIVASGEDDIFIVWDMETGKEVFSSSAAIRGSRTPNNAFFSADGKLLVTSEITENGALVSLWGVDQDWSLLTEFPIPDVVYISHDGRWLASRTGDSSLKTDILLWDLSRLPEQRFVSSGITPDEAITIPDAHNSIIYNFAFSADNTLMASASLDGTAKVWRLSDRGPELFLTLSGHTVGVSDVAFRPDGIQLATAGMDGTVRIWDITPTGNSELLSFGGHTKNIYRISLTADGKYLATASEDGLAKVWDMETGKERLSVTGHGERLFGVGISRDGSLLATAGYDNIARIWKLDLSAATAELLHSLTGHEPGSPVGGLFPGLTSAVFSPDGKHVATGGVDGLAKIWDASTGQEVLSMQVHPNRRGVTRLAFSPDSSLLLTASDGPEPLAKVWDAQSGEQVSEYRGHVQTERIWSGTFSPDGTRVATGSWGGVVKIWEARTGTERLDLTGHPSTVIGLTFSPDSEYLASASVDGTIKISDSRSGEQIRVYTAPGPILDAVFTPDGKQIITPGAGSIYVYTFDLDETVRLAYSQLTRWLAPAECRQYLHRETCPPR